MLQLLLKFLVGYYNLIYSYVCMYVYIKCYVCK